MSHACFECQQQVDDDQIAGIFEGGTDYFIGQTITWYKMICRKCIDKYNYEQQQVEDPFE